MPRYAWKAVDIVGAMHKGVLYARSPERLDEQLFARKLALIRAHKIRSIKPFLQPISGVEEFIQQLFVLVSAGVLLPDALTIVADQLTDPRLQDIIHRIGDQVSSGTSLSVAMAAYPKLFSPVSIQLIRAGEESGTLPQALESLSDHLSFARGFQRELKAAIALPMVTFALFIVVAAVIFFFVIPQFAGLFATIGKEMPPFTRAMVGVSNFMRSTQFLFLLVALGAVALGIWRYSKTSQGGRFFGSMMLKMPFVGAIMIKRFQAVFFESLALLTGRGVPLLSALAITRTAIGNAALEKSVQVIEEGVSDGQSLSDAMFLAAPTIFTQDVIAMITVGQESGKLSAVLKQLATTSRACLHRQLTRLTLFAQPFLMIVLAIFVTMLVAAVYGPLCNFSDIV